MNSMINLKDLGQGIVYVRSVDVDSLPDGLRDQAGDLTEVFAVHNHLGEPLALVADRKMAFDLAKQHEMQPASVH